MIAGEVVSWKDNYLTIRHDSNEEFRHGEPVEFRSVKNEYAERCRALFFVLLGWVIKSGKIYELPEDDRRMFRPGQSLAMQREMLYYLIRWRINYVKVGYNRQGLPVTEPKSLGDAELTDQVISKVYSDAFQYFANRLDMSDYVREYENKLREVGKLV